MEQQRHIAVLPFPFASHSLSIFTLARMIAASAPDIQISFISTSKSIASAFSGTGSDCIGNLKPYMIPDGLPQDCKPLRNPMEAIDLFLNVARDSFRQGLEAAEADRGIKVTSLLTDAFISFAGDLADERKLPWIAFWGAGPSSIAIHYHTDLIREKLFGSHSGNEDPSLDFIPGLGGLEKDDLPNEIVKFGETEDAVSRLLDDMSKQLKRTFAVVINSFEEMDQVMTAHLKSIFNMYLCVGPFALLAPSSSSATCDDSNGCLSWLDDQKPSSVAYISFGSVISPPPHEIVAIADALDKTGVPFLWSFRGDPSQVLPKEFFDRTASKGKFVAWAPQMHVLNHGSVGAFVTHGGWNSIAETITGGVPMICRPFFGDQQLNRKLISKIWRIGTGVEGDVITKDGLVDALQMVFLREEGNEMRKTIASLKKLAGEAAEPDGSSTNCLKNLIDLVSK